MSFQNVTGAAGNAASDFVIHRGIIGCTSVPRMTDNVKQIVTVAEGSVAHFLGGDNAALTSGTVVALIHGDVGTVVPHDEDGVGAAGSWLKTDPQIGADLETSSFCVSDTTEIGTPIVAVNGMMGRVGNVGIGPRMGELVQNIVCKCVALDTATVASANAAGSWTRIVTRPSLVTGAWRVVIIIKVVAGAVAGEGKGNGSEAGLCACVGGYLGAYQTVGPF